jgi:hypothetical protein
VFRPDLDRAHHRTDPVGGLFDGDPARTDRNLKVVFDTIDALRSAGSPREILDRTLDNVVDLTRARRALLIVEGAGGALAIVAGRGRGRRAYDGALDFSRSSVRTALAARRSLCVLDSTDDKAHKLTSSSVDKLGLAWRLESAGGERSLEVRAEARRQEGAWTPGWFDTAYEVERFTTLQADHGPRSKLAAAVDPARLQRGPWGAGLGVDARVRGWGQLAAALAWSERDAGSVHLQLVGQERHGLQVRGYLVRKGISEPANALDLGAALCGASVRFRAVGPLYAAFGAARHFLATERDRVPGASERVAFLAPTNEFTGTVGVEWRK